MKTFLAAILAAAAVLPGAALAQFSTSAGLAAAGEAAIPSAKSSAPSPEQSIRPEQLAGALRGGGYVIYFRHTATDFSGNDEGMKHYGDCANQRILSAAGRDTAVEIGRRIRALELPLTEVLASPYCRTLDTARLMFERAEPRNEIREMQGDDYIGLKRLLAAPVEPGANRWVVGHGTPFRAIAGPPHLAEGEAAVIRPQGTRWVVVARVQPGDWAALKASR